VKEVFEGYTNKVYGKKIVDKLAEAGVESYATKGSINNEIVINYFDQDEDNRNVRQRIDISVARAWTREPLPKGEIMEQIDSMIFGLERRLLKAKIELDNFEIYASDIERDLAVIKQARERIESFSYAMREALDVNLR
jgi:hypothetical protein